MVTIPQNHKDIASIIAQKAPTAQPADFMRYGYTAKGVPIYLHKATGKRYVANDALPGRKTPPEEVGTAVSLYYGGSSLREIRRTFEHTYDSAPSTATLYEWVVDYTRLAQSELGKLRPQTGETWVADESVIKVGGKKYWNWNVMDSRTRFLLASHLSPTRETRDAEMVMREALKVAGKPPRWVVTDRLASYIDGIERAFGADSAHIQSGGIRARINNNLSERLQGTIRQREKVMRGLKSRETAQLFMDGWRLHYNYFKPHEALKGKTPSHAARIETPLSDWEDVARLDVRPFSYARTRRELEAEPVLRERRLRGRTFRVRRGGV